MPVKKYAFSGIYRSIMEARSGNIDELQNQPFFDTPSLPLVVAVISMV
jgi:hypothetical protein